LIAGLCSTEKSFPMHLWDRLLPQEVITLNMLRTSIINPKLSAATHIYAQYDFNRAPMASPGTRIIAHETPNRRRTWDPHGQDKLNLIIYFNCACTKPIQTHTGRNIPGATIPSSCERGVMRSGYPTPSRPCKYCSMVCSAGMIRFSASSKYSLANSAQHFCPL
jgi:hypothetical protein